MKIGINTFLSTKSFSASDLELIEHVHSLGADGIEFARYAFDGFPTDAILGCAWLVSPLVARWIENIFA
jgi:hypothetical protein